MKVQTKKLIITLFFLYCLTPCLAQAKNIKVILRYDDYSSYSNREARINVEKILFKAVRSIGGSVLVGVIPFPGRDYPDFSSNTKDLPLDLTQDKRDLLINYSHDGTVIVGLHGFSHKNNVPTNRPDEYAEFRGLPEEQQTFLLRTAKNVLKSTIGIDVKVFIPPFNKYDTSTLKALNATGFELISAGVNGGPAIPELPIRYLPSGVYPENLRKVVMSAIKHGHTDVIIVTTIHPYDIKETGEADELPSFRSGKQISIEKIEQYLHQLHDEKIVQISSVQKLIDDGEDLSAGRLNADLKLRTSFVSKHRLIPEVFNLYPLQGLYYKQTTSMRMYRNQIIAAICFYMSCFLVSCVGVLFLSKWLKILRGNTAYLLVVFILIGIFSIGTRSYFSGFYLTSAVGLVICLGFLGGIALGLILKAKDTQLE